MLFHKCIIILRPQKYDYFQQKKEKRCFCGEILCINGKRLPQGSSLSRFLDAMNRVSTYTIPVNPMNARARMPAVIKAIGVPFMPSGTSISSVCSRTPAKIISASAKPQAMPAA